MQVALQPKSVRVRLMESKQYLLCLCTGYSCSSLPFNPSQMNGTYHQGYSLFILTGKQICIGKLNWIVVWLQQKA